MGVDLCVFFFQVQELKENHLNHPKNPQGPSNGRVLNLFFAGVYGPSK